MNKTAEEMFEELGYKKVNKYNGFICYELDLNNDHYKVEYKHCIDFKIRDCSISIYSKVDNNYGAFNVEDNSIFKAINKQIEELEKIRDENNN